MHSLKSVVTASILAALSTAARAADPFEPANTLAQDVIDGLTGDLAIALITIAIIAAAIGMVFNKLNKGWGIAIIIGAVLIGSAGQIASWAMGS